MDIRMTSIQPFLQEAIDAHVAIERWFAGVESVDGIAALLQRFSPCFTMITPQGATLDRAGVERLFSRAHGTRPGLRIAIDELHGLGTWPDGAAVGYRETQVDGEGRRTVRRSTALFHRDADGRVAWRHLHETYVVA